MSCNRMFFVSGFVETYVNTFKIINLDSVFFRDQKYFFASFLKSKHFGPRPTYSLHSSRKIKGLTL